MNQSAPSIAGAVEIDSLEREAAILEVKSRMAEIESAARDFLTVSSLPQIVRILKLLLTV